MASTTGQGSCQDDTKLVKLEEAQRNIPARFKSLTSRWTMHMIGNFVIGLWFFLSKSQTSKTLLFMFLLLNCILVVTYWHNECKMNLVKFEQEISNMITVEKVKTGRRV